ncbi:DUF6935 domain-containing protein [Eisenibacter elegans]|jgi:hypothetical protein|uniref:DUF6935 domain-containing protein n=1 Tax=Eisenibacter elegans TaxID=997 RepID=UPI0004023BD4|nr:hypothetical protein [Eisenibacter elegans]
MSYTHLLYYLGLWCLMAVAAPLNAQQTALATKGIKQLPNSTEAFKTLRDQVATTPQGGAQMFLIALKVYVENPELGEQLLVMAVDMERLSSGNTYQGYALGTSDGSLLRRQLEQHPHLPNSYFKGSSPQNGYQVKTPLDIECSSNPYSGDMAQGNFKVFVRSSGADSPRPLQMKRNDKGIWKVAEWSSVLVGIRQPERKVVDDL